MGLHLLGTGYDENDGANYGDRDGDGSGYGCHMQFTFADELKW